MHNNTRKEDLKILRDMRDAHKYCSFEYQILTKAIEKIDDLDKVEDEQEKEA